MLQPADQLAGHLADEDSLTAFLTATGCPPALIETHVSRLLVQTDAGENALTVLVDRQADIENEIDQRLAPLNGALLLISLTGFASLDGARTQITYTASLTVQQVLRPGEMDFATLLQSIVRATRGYKPATGNTYGDKFHVGVGGEAGVGTTGQTAVVVYEFPLTIDWPNQ